METIHPTDQTARQLPSRTPGALRLGAVWLPLMLIFSIGLWLFPAPAQAQSPVRRVNAPRFTGDIQLWDTAIFWFGQVNNTDNYADVRVGYNDTELLVYVQVFDRWLWYDTTPAPADLTAWDAISLYVDLSGNTGSTPSTSTYRFDGQLSHWQARTDYQAAYRGTGTGYVPVSIPFTTTAGWRGNGIADGQEARGWTLEYRLPFSSLGLSGPPAANQVWGLGLVLHDRDDAAGAPIADKTWPELLDPQRPTSWGQLAFSRPGYTPPPALTPITTTIRHLLNGAVVPDAHVGGHTTCGEPYDPDFFNGWGDANYAGYDQINIQNQSDVADWPCYSKYYVTFPLDALPANKVILSATLTMYQFGNAGYTSSDPDPSLIQVLTVAENWSENSITWNNAPLAVENVAETRVNPLATFPGWPGVPAHWDVSRAAAEAYGRGDPLRLALYSADTAYHSGKYFSSSDAADWNATGRPALEIVWADPAGDTFFLNLPATARAIDAGGAATYAIEIEPAGSFTAPVTLSVGAPPDLQVSLSPAVVTPPGIALLTITDTHPGPDLLPGILYTLPITATGGDAARTASISLLVGGARVYVPVLLK